MPPGARRRPPARCAGGAPVRRLVLAVPLLIILQTVLGAAGKPDIAGFLFEHGTLVRQRRDSRGEDENGR